MNKWINVRKKLPKHGEEVIVCNKHDRQYICTFLATKKIKEILQKANVPISDDMVAYNFCSQEVPGNVMKDVTHWMHILKTPNRKKQTN